MIFNKMKGYKVTNPSRSKMCGIASSSLVELKRKAIKKFQIDDQNAYFILLDGTIVDNESYFQTIPSQTVLILAREGEEVCTGTDIIYNALRAVNADYLRAGENIKQFFEENVKEKLQILAEELRKFDDAEDKTLCSMRTDHKEWFEGLDTSCSTKEDFMKRRCKDRITGFYYKACADLRKSCKTIKEKEVIDSALSKLKKKLNLDNYNAGYFDRRESIRLCDDTGQFMCSGIWNKERCSYLEKRSHIINPYRSREDRIVFSTWNLDHRIEKSRTIIPCMLSALRLVHIVCHDKGAHFSARIEPENIVISCTNGVKKVSTTKNNEKDKASQKITPFYIDPQLHASSGLLKPKAICLSGIILILLLAFFKSKILANFGSY